MLHRLTIVCALCLTPTRGARAETNSTSCKSLRIAWSGATEEWNRSAELRALQVDLESWAGATGLSVVTEPSRADLVVDVRISRVSIRDERACIEVAIGIDGSHDIAVCPTGRSTAPELKFEEARSAWKPGHRDEVLRKVKTALNTDRCARAARPPAVVGAELRSPSGPPEQPPAPPPGATTEPKQVIVLGSMIVAISLLAAICKLRSGPTAAPPKRRMSILFLAANPGGTSKLALDEECAAIQRELRLTRYGDDFEFVSRWAVTVDDMARHLMELQPTIIHFSGHARGNESLHPGAHGTIRDASSATDPGTNGILLQGEQGGSQLVCARALAMMIRSAATSARVLVLNACYSHAQAEELRRSVDCVVGMGGAITDDAALSFAVSFYRALGNRRSVGAAVKHAIATLAAKQVPDACRPRLRARDGLDAHQVVLSARRPVRYERLVRAATSIAGLSLAGNDAPADSQPWFTPIP